VLSRPKAKLLIEYCWLNLTPANALPLVLPIQLFELPYTPSLRPALSWIE